ncbi:MAG: aminoacyl-tRNA hydrolase [Calditerrivibrio sp.]|nr:aminoacyl-tRNA hydrolase [Calditerrivibrio sp.]MCA1931992.1 aminoacyl-tRNA hydrolase [Calditerrivibrio sp.]MCA1980170.1 aminoacyl-tRNA hydrolase [Calditerrivibrio sp.]
MNRFLVVGLGNPGKQYEMTRHNIGFMVVDELAKSIVVNFKGGFNADYAVGEIGGKRVYLAKPQTYMNLSGKAVSEIAGYFDIESGNVIVVHDDLDMEFGKIKLRMGGSSGGHRGIESIIASIDTDKFIRVKMGIGKPQHKNMPGYVLGEFSKEEKSLLDRFVELGCMAVKEILQSDLKKAMNIFNNKIITQEVKEQCQV